MKTYVVILCFLTSTPIWSQTLTQATTLLREADLLLTKNQYEAARTKAVQALEIARKFPDGFRTQADACMLIGVAWRKVDNFDEAVDYYNQALKIREEILKDSLAAGCSLSSRSAVEYENWELTRALSSALEAERYFKTRQGFESDSLVAMLYNNLANIYEALDSLDLAIATNIKGLAYFPLTRDTFTKAVGEYGLAKRLVMKGQTEEAIMHCDSARYYYTWKHNTDSVRLGQCYEMRGAIEMEKKHAEPHKAIPYLEQARDILLRFPEATGALSNIYFNLAQAYELTGQLEKARAAYNKAREYYTDESDQPQFKELIETRIENTTSQIDRNIYFWAGISILFCLALALSILWYQTRSKKILAQQSLISAQQALVSSQRLLIQEKEINTLKDQMFQLRHDLVKNFLQNIDLLIGAAEPEKTGETFQKIKFLTNTVLAQVGYSNMVKEPETLKPFAQNMHLQAEISAMMPVLDATYIDDLPDIKLSAILRENLVAIVAESFTNIRKYAFDSDASIKTASIRFEYHYEQGLILTIEDQGKGFDPSSAGRSGLRNLENRAAAINGTLTIESTVGQGTTIRLVVPDAGEDPQ